MPFRLASRPSTWFIFVCLLLFLSNGGIAAAQMLPVDTAQAEAKPTWPVDTLGRRTPRGTVNGFIRAVATKDYIRAGMYLALDPSQKKKTRPLLAQGLQHLLETDGRLNPSSLLSDQEEGKQDDELADSLDHVGTVNYEGQTIDLLLERSTDAFGGPVWLFSSGTMLQIPTHFEDAGDSTVVERFAPLVLKENHWGGIPVAHWLGMLLIIALAYFVAMFLIRLAIYLIMLVWKNAKEEPYHGIINSFVLPLRLYFTVVLFIIGSKRVGISIIVRQLFSDIALIAAVVALLMLVWQLMNYGSKFMERRMLAKGNFSAISAILFLRRAAKLALVVMGAMVVLNTMGVHLTAWLAGLGIVGIALALGTQKTVENFVGSVTLIADQPVRVGDYCKVGDVSGTVESIGMRTTSIRTNDRTIVTIPNGEFSSLRIENFAPRDRFLFNTVVTLHIQAASVQVRKVLEGLRIMLKDHPKVTADPARVRLIGILPDGYQVEIFSYIDTTDVNEYLEVREELYLTMMEVVAASGTSFAIPLQPLVLKNEGSGRPAADDGDDEE